MAEPLTAGLPTDLDISGGFVVRVTAVDANTGNTVTGVNVSNIVVTGRNLIGPAVPEPSPLLDFEWLNLPQPGAA